jgi:hypothetical protein
MGRALSSSAPTPVEVAVATRGRGEQEQRLEHDVFLSLASSLCTPGGAVRL